MGPFDKLADAMITQYPLLAFFLLVALNGLIIWLYNSLKWFVKREFERMERHQLLQDQDRQRIDQRLDTDIKRVETRLNQYDITIAVSKQSFDDLVTTINDHIRREENLPTQVGQIVADVQWIKTTLVNGYGKKQGPTYSEPRQP